MNHVWERRWGGTWLQDSSGKHFVAEVKKQSGVMAWDACFMGNYETGFDSFQKAKRWAEKQAEEQEAP